MEYHIRINRWGRIGVFKLYCLDVRYIRFVDFFTSIREAIHYCHKLPTTIITTSEGL